MKKILFALAFLLPLALLSQEVISSSLEIETSQDSFFYLKVTEIREIGGPLDDTVTTRIYLGTEKAAATSLFNAAVQKEQFVSAGLRRGLVAQTYELSGQTETVNATTNYNTLSDLYEDVTNRTLADSTRTAYYNFYGVNRSNEPDSTKSGVLYRLTDLIANPDTTYICEMIAVGNGTWRLRDTSTLQTWVIVPYSRENLRLNQFRGENYELIWTREVFANGRRVYSPTTRILPNMSAIETNPLRLIRLE